MNQRKKIYISIAIFGVTTILLVVLICVPILRNIQKYSEDAISQKKELALLQEEIETFSETKFLYIDSEEEINRIYKLFYDPENPLDFLDFLTKSPENYGVRNEILKMSANTIDEPNLWPSISFQISSTGSFPNLMKFLKTLEAGPYLIEISNVTIKRLAAGEIRGEGSFFPYLGDVNAILLIKVYSK